MIQEEKILTLEEPGQTLTFAVGLDWLKDRFNVLTEEDLQVALKENKIPVEDIYTIASAEQPKQSGFRFIESSKKTYKPKIAIEPLGQAIQLEWDEADKAVNAWCQKHKLCFCEVEKSDESIMICVKVANCFPDDICRKIKKLYLKYDPEKINYSPTDFEPESWKEAYENRTTLYLSETVSQNILFDILKEDRHIVYKRLFALDQYIILTEN